MQFRTLEATAVSIIVAAFAEVMEMTPANQILAGLSVSPQGNYTIQQTSSPKGAIDGKSGQAIPANTLCNLWQSGKDAKDVRVFIVKAKKPKTPKATKSDSLREMIREEILAALTATK